MIGVGTLSAAPWSSVVAGTNTSSTSVEASSVSALQAPNNDVLKPPDYQELLDAIETAFKTNTPLRISLSKVFLHTMSGRPLNSPARDDAIIDISIKNAANKVFKDPYRSILEILFNAIDAGLLPEETIGQFGLGLHSIYSLFFLKEIGGVKFLFMSTSKELKGFQFTLELEQITNEIIVTFSSCTPKSHSGTTVQIIPDKPFSDEVVDRIFHYIHYADFTSKANITLKHHSNIHKLGCRPTQSENNHVWVNLDPKCIEITDQGIGISPEIALKHMFRISNSNKPTAKINFQKESECRFVKWSGKTEAKKSYALILVNEIVVFEAKMTGMHFKDGMDFGVFLPDCHQTTARNSFSIKFEVIKKLIDRTIRDSVNQPMHVAGLYLTLNLWEKSNGNDDIRGLYTGYLKKQIREWLINNSSVIPIDLNYAHFFDKLLSKSVPRIFLPPSLFSFNSYKLEKELKKQIEGRASTSVAKKGIEGTLIDGCYIAFIKSVVKIPSNMFRNLVFIPKSARKDLHNLQQLKKHLLYKFPEISPKKTNELGFIDDSIKRLEQSNFEIPTNFAMGICQFNTVLCMPIKNNANNPQTSLILEHFRQCYLSILNLGLRFDLKFEALSYTSTKFKVHPIFDGDPLKSLHAIEKLIFNLANHTASFNNLLNWTLEYWSDIADLSDSPHEQGDRLFSEKVLLIPGPTPISPLGLAAELLSLAVPFETLIFLTNLKSLHEFMLLGHLIKQLKSECPNFQFYVRNYNFFNSQLRQYIDFVLHCRLTSSEIEGLYQRNIRSSYTTFPTNQQFTTFLSFFENKTQMIDSRSNFLDLITQNCLLGKGKLTFRLKQLMKAFYKNPGMRETLRAGKLYDALNEVERSDDIDLNRIKQLIQQTSSVSYFQSIFTALLRNSVDAIRSLWYQSKDIIFSVELLNSTSLCITVQDFVGFPTLETGLELLAFDYTNKVKQIGEMGNEFFTIYQQAQQVVVTSRIAANNKVYIISILPIRNEAKVVEDLQIRWVEASPEFYLAHPKFHGTKVEIRTVIKDVLAAKTDYLNACTALSSILESSSLHHEKISLWKLENQKLVSVDNAGTLLYHDLPSGISVEATKADSIHSFVTVGGVFYVSLSLLHEQYQLIPRNFFDYLNHGICLNLPIGYGKVVQNRNELLLTPNQVQSIRISLANAFYHNFHNYLGWEYFLFSQDTSHVNALHAFNIDRLPDQKREYLAACVDSNEYHALEVFTTHFQPALLDKAPCKNFLELLNHYTSKIIQEYRVLNVTIRSEFTYIEGRINNQNKLKAFTEDEKLKEIETLKKVAAEWNLRLSRLISKLLEWAPFPGIGLKENQFLEQLFLKSVKPWILRKVAPGGFPISESETTIHAIFPFLRTETVIQDSKKLDFSSHLPMVKPCKKLLAMLEVFFQKYIELYITKTKKTIPIPKFRFYYQPGDAYLAYFLKGKPGSISFNLSQADFPKYIQLFLCIFENNPVRIKEAMVSLLIPTLSSGGVLNHEIEHSLQQNSCQNSIHEYVRNIFNESEFFESSVRTSAHLAMQNCLLVECIDFAQELLKKDYSSTEILVLYKLIELFKDKQVLPWLMEQCKIAKS